MVTELYYDEKITACRAVLLTIKALDIQIHLHEIDFLDKEQFTSELVKLNPQCTVPILVDENLIICDSHAISGYLVAKYGNESDLYPNDIRERALIDQKLHFDSNVLLPRLNDLLMPITVLGEKEIPKEKLTALREAYEFLNKFLEEHVFIASDNLTIADFSCVASISTASILLPISSEMYPKLFHWYQKCKSLPYYNEANGTGLTKADAFIEKKLGNFYCKIIS